MFPCYNFIDNFLQTIFIHSNKIILSRTLYVIQVHMKYKRQYGVFNYEWRYEHNNNKTLVGSMQAIMHKIKLHNTQTKNLK